jgi:hypothetical protein
MTKNKQVIIGAQNDPICAAQLATAEGSASAQADILPAGDP